MAKVSAGEDLQRQAEVFVGRVGDAGRVGNVNFDAFFEPLFSFMLIRVAIDFVPGDVVQGSRQTGPDKANTDNVKSMILSSICLIINANDLRHHL